MIGRGWQSDIQDESVAGTEAGIHLEQLEEASAEQSRAHEQHYRGGHLRYDQRSAKPHRGAGARLRALRLRERRTQIAAAGAHRGEESHGQRGCYRDSEREREHRPAHVDAGGSWYVAALQRQQRSHPHGREQHSEYPAADGQHE